jgi:hypothetical protein
MVSLDHTISSIAGYHRRHLMFSQTRASGRLANDHILAACLRPTYASLQEPRLSCRQPTHDTLACTIRPRTYVRMSSKTHIPNASFQEARTRSSAMITFLRHICRPLSSCNLRQTRASGSPVFHVAISPTTFRHVQFSCVIKHWRLKCEPPGGSYSGVLMLNNNKGSGFDVNATTTIHRK